MRYVYLFSVLVLISSCAHNTLRLRKVDKHDHVEVVQQDVKEKRSKENSNRPEVISVTEETASLENAELKEQSTLTSVEITTHDSESPQILELDSSAPEEVEPNNAYKVEEAFKAEKNAKSARNLMILSFASLIIPFLSIFSMIFFITGSVLLFLSNRSNYITPSGERFARVARIMQIVYVVLFILALAAVLALIFL